MMLSSMPQYKYNINITDTSLWHMLIIIYHKKISTMQERGKNTYSHKDNIGFGYMRHIDVEGNYADREVPYNSCEGGTVVVDEEYTVVGG